MTADKVRQAAQHLNSIMATTVMPQPEVIKPDVNQGLFSGDSFDEILDPTTLQTSTRILKVIDRYRLKSSAKPSRADEGHLKFPPD